MPSEPFKNTFTTPLVEVLEAYTTKSTRVPAAIVPVILAKLPEELLVVGAGIVIDAPGNGVNVVLFGAAV
ncbi:hypothetical protein [Anaerosporobacter faecicola]|uniref:hypothetical protein n=1 Tax=Anaerosporobacter faecicola TaxID=2718714 RepID=UPI00143B7DE9|nr:hypothetical protein [Anaerosporobacter faecicola]